MGGQSAIKNPKKLFSQIGGGGTSPADQTRITNLENGRYKVTYYEIISGASGSLTLPTGATINADEFGLSGNCILSKIDGFNKPTFQSPVTSGGVVVTSSLDVNTGAWVASGAYTDASVALIYSVSINALNYGNLVYSRIVETAIIPVTSINGIVAGGDLTGTYPNPTITTINGITKSFYDPTSSIQTQLNGKQATLVSGTNIKTINSTSILGTGNIVITGGTGDALVANPLSQFAATTSAQLAGVMSDETGTGLVVFNTSPNLVTPNIGAATALSVTLSGNISQAAWTTSGLRLKGVTSTFTDTTSVGTVPTAYTDVLGGNTIAATSVTTFTNYITAFFKDAIAGLNVTFTNKFALGAESAIFGTSNQTTISNAGVLTSTNPAFKSSVLLKNVAGTFDATITQTGAAATAIILPPVSTTLVGKTGTAVANQIPFYSDANQVNTSANLTYNGSRFSVVGNSVFGANLASLNAGYPVEITDYCVVREQAVANCRVLIFGINSTRALFSPTYYGGTTYVPIIFQTSDVDRLKISVNGDVNVATKAFIGNTTTSPTALLTIAAGTATANTAQIKLLNGTRLTTPEAGAITLENNLYHTNSSLVRYGVGGTIKDFITDVASTAVVTEQDIYTYTTLANTLNVNGDKIDAEYGLQLTSTGGITKQLKAYFGGTVIFDSGALSISASTDFCLNVFVIRDSATSVRCVVTANTTGAATNAFAKVTKVSGLTLSNTNIIKVTGTVGTGAVAGDITGVCGMIEIKASA